MAIFTVHQWHLVPLPRSSHGVLLELPTHTCACECARAHVRTSVRVHTHTVRTRCAYTLPWPHKSHSLCLLLGTLLLSLGAVFWRLFHIDTLKILFLTTANSSIPSTVV